MSDRIVHMDSDPTVGCWPDTSPDCPCCGGPMAGWLCDHCDHGFSGDWWEDDGAVSPASQVKAMKACTTHRECLGCDLFVQCDDLPGQPGCDRAAEPA